MNKTYTENISLKASLSKDKTNEQKRQEMKIK